MTETAARYATVAKDFTTRVEQVPPDAWDRPSPCEGWVARDVVRHMVQTSQFFLGRTAAPALEAPSVDEDPAGAWAAARDAVLAALNDPEIATAEYDTPMGKSTFEQTVGMFGVGDVLVHTWDLARATGLDETLNADEVHRLFSAMEPMDEMMRKGDSFGPKVDVAADADEQTKLIAFTGRDPQA